MFNGIDAPRQKVNRSRDRGSMDQIKQRNPQTPITNSEAMRLAIMPNPTAADRDDFQSLGPMFDALTPEQEQRVQQVMNSWGFAKYGLPVSDVKRAIRKVRNNFP